MGGGGAMRAAAKVAGIGVFNSGLRAEHPAASAARKAARPVSTVVSPSDDVKLVASSENRKIDASVRRPYCEIDGWEFAGGEDELFMEYGEPMPRLVFGGAPTLQEAKEATSELKDTLEKTYLSPNTTGLADSSASGQGSGMLLLSNSEYQETKAWLTSEVAVTPSEPKHAIQAFRLLNESPAAQTVVASIASDPNVWNAVLQNEALVGFLQFHKTNAAVSDMDPSMKESVAEADFQNQQSSKCFDESGDSEDTVSGNGFKDILENISEKARNIKATVVEMVNSLSDTFQNLFRGGQVEGDLSVHADGTATSADRAIGASIMGLVVMVIMVVVLKRG